MAKVAEILEFLDQRAPMRTALSFDNVGLLVGDPAAQVGRVLVALDITTPVVEEARAWGAELIVAHHPVIFDALKRVVAGDPAAERVIALVRGGISAICMHTNLDAAQGGVNDALAAALHVQRETWLDPIADDAGIGWVGALSAPMPFAQFLEHTARALQVSGLRYQQSGAQVRRVAVGGGSCGSMLAQAAALGCDTFVTADVKHSQWLDAAEYRINLIDAGHFATENVVVAPLAGQLAQAFPALCVRVSQAQRDPVSYFTTEEAHHGA